MRSICSLIVLTLLKNAQAYLAASWIIIVMSLVIIGAIHIYRFHADTYGTHGKLFLLVTFAGLHVRGWNLHATFAIAAVTPHFILKV